MKRMISYPQTDPLGLSTGRDWQKAHKAVKLEPEVEVALIKVAGAWATEINRSRPDCTTSDLVKSFRDAYSSLVLTFLLPEDKA